MCVILLKPAGVKMPAFEILEKMWNCNRDGAGLAISNKRNVTIEKGFMTLEALKDHYERKQLATLTHKLIVVHFRIGTHGLKDGGNTHPFPMGSTPETIRQLELTTNEAVFHNGIFQLSMTEKHVSDTGQFIIDAAKKGEGTTILSHWDSDSKTVGWSKLCVVRPAGCYDLRGTWTYSDQAEGCLVSNTGWATVQAGAYHDDAWGDRGKKGKAKKVTTPCYGAYGSAWDDDDMDNWWSRNQKVKVITAPHEEGFTIRSIDLECDIPKELQRFFVPDKLWGESKHAPLRFDAKDWAAHNKGVDYHTVCPFNEGAEFGFKSEIPEHLESCFTWNQRKGAYVFEVALWERDVLAKAKPAETVTDPGKELESNVGHAPVKYSGGKAILDLNDLIYDDEYEWAALMVPDYLWDDFTNYFYQHYNSQFELEEIYDFVEQDGIAAYWFNDQVINALIEESDEIAAGSEKAEMLENLRVDA